MSTPALDWVWAVSDQTVLYRLDYIYFIICLSLSTLPIDWVWAVSERTIFATIARKINKGSGTGVVVEDVGVDEDN